MEHDRLGVGIAEQIDQLLVAIAIVGVDRASPALKAA